MGSVVCEALVVGAFIDTPYTARDGSERAAKELMVRGLTVLDWAQEPGVGDDEVVASAPGGLTAPLSFLGD